MIIFDNPLVANHSFEELYKQLQALLVKQPRLNTGQWQSQDISNKPMLATHELTNVSFALTLADTPDQLAIETGAHLPWAEDHFQERVGGKPLNPAPSEAWWPFAQQGNQAHKSEGKAFSHTYPERMWPKWAPQELADQLAQELKETWRGKYGIRFEYGDLNGVVNQLCEGPLTRQAYLPIWFPEDTGATLGRRVPCTIGYHFMIRNNRLQITYYMRSCDFIRHFQDDVYMAGRLAQWMVKKVTQWRCRYRPELGPIQVDQLIMHIVSLHAFAGDMGAMQVRNITGKAWA